MHAGPGERERRRTGRPALTWPVILALAAIAALALLDPFHGDGEPEAPAEASSAPVGDPLAGPELPAQGALAGRIVLAERSSCVARVVDLEHLAVSRAGPAGGCSLSVSPAGTEAVRWSAPRGSRSFPLRLLDLETGRSPATLLGPAVGPAAWSADGSSVAWCGPDGATTVRAAGGATRRVAGCDPRFLGSGALVTRPPGFLDTRILENGSVLLDARDLASALPADAGRPLTVLGYDAAGDRLAVVVVGVGHSAVVQALEVWEARSPVASVELARTTPGVLVDAGDFGFAGKVVRLSPSGLEVAVAPPSGSGGLQLVDLRSGRRLLLPAQSAFDWSPDGEWLALAGDGTVLVYGPDRSTYSYRLPLDAAALAWRP